MPSWVNEFLPWVQALFTAAAVYVAWRALRHDQVEHDEDRTSDITRSRVSNAAQDARVQAMISEFTVKFDRAFAELKEQSDKFIRHDRECIGDKVRLATQMEENTRTIEAVGRTVANLERRVGYWARDESIANTRAKLTGNDT